MGSSNICVSGVERAGGASGGGPGMSIVILEGKVGQLFWKFNYSAIIYRLHLCDLNHSILPNIGSLIRNLYSRESRPRNY